MMKRYTLLAAALLATFPAFSQNLLYPDYSFQNCGKIRDAILPGSSDVVTTAFRLSNGRILLAGTVGTSDNGFSIGLARHLPNGNPDSSFGANGKVAARITLRATCLGASLQPDGKILVAGQEAPSNAGSQQIPCITRFHGHGALDTAWGNGGQQAFRFDAVSSGRMVQAFPLAGGKTLALGLSSSNINGGVNGFGAVRFDADGEFDPGFGTGGMIRVPINRFNGAVASLKSPIDSLYYLLLQTYNAATDRYDLEIMRFTPSGIDPAFHGGTPDTILASQLGWGSSTPILFADIQSDGKLVVVSVTNNTHWHIARINANGTLDNNFGTAGVVNLSFQTLRGYGGEPRGLTVLADGKILVTGTASIGFGIGTSVRLLANGGLDAGWGDQGFLNLDLNRNSGTHGVAGYLPDGAGHLFYGTDFAGDGNDYVLARFITDPPIATVVADKDSICPGDTAHFRLANGTCATSVQWFRDGGSAGSGPTLSVTGGGTYTAIVDFGGVVDTSQGVVLWRSTLTEPTIIQDRGLLTSSVTGPGYRYQWYYNGTPIGGATGPAHLATIAGTYAVEVYDGPCVLSSLTTSVAVLSSKPALARAVTAVWEESSQAIRLSGETTGWTGACLIAADGRRIPLRKTGADRWAASVPVNTGIYRLKLVSSGSSQALGLPISR